MQQLTEYAPYSYEVHENPQATYASLRETCPVYHNERLDFWALLRFEDAQRASRDWEAFTTRDGTFLNDEIAFMRRFFPEEGKFLDLDPPRHRELQNLVAKPFSIQAIKAMEPEIQRLAVELMEAFVDSGKADLATDFAGPLPVRVISEMLGIPRSDQDRISQLSHDVFERDPDGEAPPRALEGGQALHDYFREMINGRRLEPRDDIVSHLTHADVDGVPLTDNELIGMIFLLYVAGNETTRMLIATTLMLLGERPDERARMIADPAAIRVGASGGEVNDSLTALCHAQGFGPGLGTGHIQDFEDWPSTPFRPGSADRIESGMILAADIFCDKNGPQRTAHCEDTLAVGDEDLRAELAERCPEVSARIDSRRVFMRDQLNLQVPDDLLPLTVAPAYFAPFWLEPDMALRAA